MISLNGFVFDDRDVFGGMIPEWRTAYLACKDEKERCLIVVFHREIHATKYYATS